MQIKFIFCFLKIANLILQKLHMAQAKKWREIAALFLILYQ